MKVILRADVEKLGHLGDIVNVKPGFGRNYLLPQQLASLATPANIRVFELERKKLQARMDALRSAASLVAEKLEGVVVTIAMRVGDNDKLYGSVTPAMIGEALAAMGIEVDRHRLLLDGAIRTLGEYNVRARLHADVVPAFTVKVVSDEKRVVEEEAPVEAAAEAEAADHEPAGSRARLRRSHREPEHHGVHRCVRVHLLQLCGHPYLGLRLYPSLHGL